jgi:hypothetical protein
MIFRPMTDHEVSAVAFRKPGSRRTGHAFVLPQRVRYAPGRRHRSSALITHLLDPIPRVSIDGRCPTIPRVVYERRYLGGQVYISPRRAFVSRMAFSTRAT